MNIKKTALLISILLVFAAVLAWLLLYTSFLTDAQINAFTGTHALLINFVSAFVWPALAVVAGKLLAIMDKNNPNNSIVDLIRDSIQFGRGGAPPAKT